MQAGWSTSTVVQLSRPSASLDDQFLMHEIGHKPTSLSMASTTQYWSPMSQHQWASTTKFFSGELKSMLVQVFSCTTFLIWGSYDAFAERKVATCVLDSYKHRLDLPVLMLDSTRKPCKFGWPVLDASSRTSKLANSGAEDIKCWLDGIGDLCKGKVETLYLLKLILKLHVQTLSQHSHSKVKLFLPNSGDEFEH